MAGTQVQSGVVPGCGDGTDEEQVSLIAEAGQVLLIEGGSEWLTKTEDKQQSCNVTIIK